MPLSVPHVMRTPTRRPTWVAGSAGSPSLESTSGTPSMSDGLAAATAALNQTIQRLISSIENNGNKGEVVGDIMSALGASIHELAVSVHELAEAYPPGNGDVDGTPDQPG